MSRAYRALLISLGGFLFLGGVVGLVFSVIMTASTREHVSSFIGGVIAVACGFLVSRAAYRQQLPGWFARLAGLDQ